MKIPEITNYFSVQSFFTDFYQLNKKAKSSFSYRSFSNKTKWPSSYLLDLIKGRKKLTISRAVQFAQIFKLTSGQTEHLIYLCLSEFDDKGVQSYFKTEIKQKSQSLKNLSFDQIYEYVDYLPATYLHELIEWGQGQFPIQKLKEKMLIFPELQEEVVFKEALEFLLKKKFISENKKNYFISTLTDKDTISYSDKAEFNPTKLAEYHTSSLKSLLELFQYFTGKGSLTFSSYINIPKDKFPEVIEKSREFVKYMIGLTKMPKSKNVTDQKCFQFELHILSLFKDS